MIYLVRHGQTRFNLERRYQGACDSPLTALGEDQARAVGRLLAELAPRDCPIVSSPLGRARATAELIRRAGGFTSDITLDPRLAEISMGAWDGRLISEIDTAAAGFTSEDLPPDWYMRSPDGETYAQFAARLGDWVESVRSLPGPLIVVSHGVAGRVIRGLYAHLDKDTALRLPVPQDAVFRLNDGTIERIDCAPASAGTS